MSAGPQPQRAIVIANPNAGRLPEETRRAVVTALRETLDAEVSWTMRDTGISVAREAATSGADLVVAFGGDGHVNEVVNGIAGTDVPLGIVPGGTMNVFSRTIGVPQDPFEAIDFLVRRLREPVRVVPLGRTNDRYFTFSAGCGFDALAAEHVEKHLNNKRRYGELFFYWSAFRVLAHSFSMRSPRMSIRGPFGEIPVAMAIATNARPYAYFAGRPVDLTPNVTLDGGVDVFAMKTMRLEALPLYIWRVAVSRDLVHHRDAFYQSDLASFEVVAHKPFNRHVDGEPLPPADRVSFSVVKDALRVLA
jgi:diacylglycerol kinase family enzyme